MAEETLFNPSKHTKAATIIGVTGGKISSLVRDCPQDPLSVGDLARLPKEQRRALYAERPALSTAAYKKLMAEISKEEAAMYEQEDREDAVQDNVNEEPEDAVQEKVNEEPDDTVQEKVNEEPEDAVQEMVNTGLNIQRVDEFVVDSEDIILTTADVK